MPGGDFYGERVLAADAADGMLAHRLCSGRKCVIHGEEQGFIGGVGAAPIAPPTFVFGRGTALRTRNL